MKIFLYTLQIGTKYSYVIRFLIPFTLNASHKIYTYSMCPDLEMQRKEKMICLLRSWRERKEHPGKLWRSTGWLHWKLHLSWLHLLWDTQTLIPTLKLHCGMGCPAQIHSLELNFDIFVVLLVVGLWIFAWKRISLPVLKDFISEGINPTTISVFPGKVY